MNAFAKSRFLLPVLFLAIMMSGCIPSLHPIYTDATREVDDRLLGIWSLEPSSLLESLDYDLEITPNGDSTLRLSSADSDIEVTKEMVKEAFGKSHEELLLSNKSIWRFERAANVEFENKSSEFISMTVGVPSFAPKGYELRSTKELPFYILTHEEFEGEVTTVSYLLVHMTKIGGEMYLDFVPFPKQDRRHQGAFAANYISGHTFAKVELGEGNLSIRMFDGEIIEDLVKRRKIRLQHERLGLDGDIILTASTKELRAFIGKYGNNTDLFDDAQVLVQL